MTGPIEHRDLRTPGKRRAPQRHARMMAADSGSYPSPNYSSRGGATVTGVVIHSAEGPTDADALGRYFAQPSVQASSHVGIDDGKTVAYVDPRFEAWTLRNGNPWTDNAEMCARAAWSRAEWLAHPEMLRQAAVWVAARCKARGIPPKRITADDIRAGRRTGYFAHWDYTLGTGDGTHWDVGTGFPWDIFDGLVQSAYNPDPTPEDWLMALTDSEAREILALARYMNKGREGDLFIHEIPARVAGLVALDPKALAAAIAADLPVAGAASEADLEKALRNVLGSLDNKS